MRRLGLRLPAVEGDAQEERTQGERAARRKKQHRLGGRRRAKGGSGGGAPGQRRSSAFPNAVVFLPTHGNHAVGGGSDDHGDDHGPPCPGSGGSLLSPAASASGDRRSLGCDHDALLSELSLHLAGRDRSCGGPHPCRKQKRPSCDAATPHMSIGSDQGIKVEEGEESDEALDPVKHSFSIALKECQNRRFRSDTLSSPAESKQRWRRPASLDLNGQANEVTFSSPGFFIAGPSMKKSSTVSVRSRSGTFPSPSTPNYHHGGCTAGYQNQKGWSSERVPLPANASRRYGGTSALLSFSNGKTLPSKWEDAEKWIFSPVSGEGGIGRPTGLPPHHRRPKSKSGPLGTAMEMERGCCGSASCGRGESSNEFIGIVGSEKGGRRSYSAHADEGIVRSASAHGCSDLLIQSSSSLPSSQDENLEGTKDADTMISPVIVRKDVATQMSPQGSTQSSPKERPHFSPSTVSSPTIEELQSPLSKLDVRDVQVDDGVTVTRWSKKHVSRCTDKGSVNIVEWKKKTVESLASAWEVVETAKCISKIKREEAKITAWENLQKAKAEAAIRKLEMKLEKKRSSSMDKILNKLKSAQGKALEMRNTANGGQANKVARTPKMASSFRKAGQMSSLSGCFSCHAS